MGSRSFQQPLAVLAMVFLLPNAVCNAGCVELPKGLQKRAAADVGVRPSSFIILLAKAATPTKPAPKRAVPC